MTSGSLGRRLECVRPPRARGEVGSVEKPGRWLRDHERNGQYNIIIGLIGLVVAVVFGFLWLHSFGAGSSSEVAVPPGARTAPPAAQAIVEGWSRIPAQAGVFGNANVEQITDVSAGDGTFIAVGAHDSKPAIWRATVPQRWSRLTRVDQTPSSRPALIWSVAYDSGLWVAVGHDSNHAAVWTSSDADTWSLAPRDDPTYGTASQYSAMYSVVRFHGRWYASGDFVAGGTTPQVAAVWMSSDGIHWTRSTLGTERARQVVDRPAMVHLYATAHALVGVGSNASLSTSSPTQKCLAWASTDGVHWTAGSGPGGGFGDGSKACSFSSVAYGHGVWLAVGNNGTAGAAWKSADGVHWTESTDGVTSLFDANGKTGVNDVVPTLTGWIAVGYSPGSGLTGDASVWDSKDASRWLQVRQRPDVFGGADRQIMACLLLTSSGAIAAGTDASAGDTSAAVWVKQGVAP